MPTPYSIVDAFAAEPFAGNAAGVCLLDEPGDPAWMQALATELAQPATAFVTADFELRWFTPLVELGVCGHGTLAAGHVLWEAGIDGPLEFSTAAGPLPVTRDGGSIFVSLPGDEVTAAKAPELAGSTGAVEVWRTPIDHLLVLESPDAVRALEPDLELIGGIDTRGVIVTAEGGDGADFTTRFFAPSLGLPEDQATGSIHAALGPFWASRLDRTELRGRQVSRRGGTIDVRVAGERVLVGGPAVTVARGTIS